MDFTEKRTPDYSLCLYNRNLKLACQILELKFLIDEILICTLNEQHRALTGAVLYCTLVEGGCRYWLKIVAGWHVCRHIICTRPQRRSI